MTQIPPAKAPKDTEYFGYIGTLEYAKKRHKSKFGYVPDFAVPVYGGFLLPVKGE